MSKKMIGWKWAAILGIIFILASQISYAEVVSIHPAQDTWIASGEQKDTPHGADTYLWVANPGHYTAWGLVKFDDLSSIPKKSLIHSATLKIFCYHHRYKAPHQLTLYEIKSRWDELTVSWSSLPEFGTSPLAERYVKSSVQGSWITWSGDNLTQLVKRWHKGSSPNHGLLIRADTKSDNTYGFRSKEADVGRPILEVKYKLPQADININLESPTGEPVAPEISLLFRYNTSWKEVERKRPVSHSYTFQDKSAGKYNVEAYADDMFIAATGPFRLKGEDVSRTLATPHKRPLEVVVYRSDGRIPLPGAKVKLYSWNGHKKDYTLRREKSTNTKGKVVFSCWPTLLADKGEHYLIKVVHEGSVVGEAQKVSVDKDKGAFITISATL